MSKVGMRRKCPNNQSRVQKVHMRCKEQVLIKKCASALNQGRSSHTVGHCEGMKCNDRSRFQGTIDERG